MATVYAIGTDSNTVHAVLTLPHGGYARHECARTNGLGYTSAGGNHCTISDCQLGALTAVDNVCTRSDEHIRADLNVPGNVDAR